MHYGTLLNLTEFLSYNIIKDIVTSISSYLSASVTINIITKFWSVTYKMHTNHKKILDADTVR